MNNRLLMKLGCLAILLTSGASASETYEYDVLGRLTQVNYDDGSGITYKYDAAGNRTQVVIGRAVNPNAPSTFVVVPLNGFTVIVAD